MSVLNGLIRANRSISRKITPQNIKDTHAYERYNTEVIKQIIQPRVNRVLDIGAGRKWYFGEKIKNIAGIHLIGLDENMDLLNENPSLDERVLGDVSREINVEENSVDVITGRAIVEHVEDKNAMLQNCHKILRPGGMIILVFINGYSPPAILNRIIPRRIARELVFKLQQASEKDMGFRPFYNGTSASQFRKLLEQNGFEIEFEYQSYFSSGYFGFFTPLYILSMIIDGIRNMVGIKKISAFNLFVATKIPCEDSDRLFINTRMISE